MSEHTPTPWKVDKWLGSPAYQWVIAYDAGDKGRGISIAETVGGTGKEKANARHIVHCVNNHDPLVTALKDAMAIIEADANTEENYGSLCRIGSALADVKVKP